MISADVGALVVGAGIAGLGAALELDAAVGDVLVVDASDRPGGVMRTDHFSGYVVERGPNTFQVKAPALSLLRRLRLDEALVEAAPAGRRRSLVRNGALVSIPTSPVALARTPLLSGRGKLRLLAEPLVRRRDARVESVSEFVSRRLGAETSSALVAPFLTGVYAGDETRLGAEAVFPSLVEMERRSGSIFAGLLRGAMARSRPRGLRGSWSTRQGLGPLARRLVGALREPPALETKVSSLRRDGDAWRVELTGRGGDRTVRAARVVVATPAPEASALLRAECAELADVLGGVDYAPVVGIAVGVDPSSVREPIDGFGFLVPRGERLGFLGCLYMSRLFPGRAPERRELLQVLLGGARRREAVDLPDDRLTAELASDLDRVLGLAADPQFLAVTRWRRAIPQPDRHHVARIARMGELARRHPGLALAGAYVAGVGVSDALASGVDAARALLARVD